MFPEKLPIIGLWPFTQASLRGVRSLFSPYPAGPMSHLLNPSTICWASAMCWALYSILERWPDIGPALEADSFHSGFSKYTDTQKVSKWACLYRTALRGSGEEVICLWDWVKLLRKKHDGVTFQPGLINGPDNGWVGVCQGRSVVRKALRTEAPAWAKANSGLQLHRAYSNLTKNGRCSSMSNFTFAGGIGDFFLSMK